jgi:hypothetical protein
MKQQITCQCGAVYERTEKKLTHIDSNSFDCRCCGITLETWNGPRVPIFTLIREPEEKMTY